MIRCSLRVITVGSFIACCLTNWATAAVITFQEGDSNSYSSTQDTHIRSADSGGAYGGAATVVADGDDGGGLTQGLIRFDNLFGMGPNQIPVGATIVSATLRLNTDNVSPNTMNLHQMLQTWSESTTYGSGFGGNGIQANGSEASSTPLATFIPNVDEQLLNFDVTSSLQAWVTNPSQNFGWAILPTGTDGYQTNSSEHGTQGLRPFLTVDFLLAVPEPSSIALFSLLGVVGIAAAGWCGRRRSAAR